MSLWKTFKSKWFQNLHSKPLLFFPVIVSFHALFLTVPGLAAVPLSQSIQQLDFGKIKTFTGMRAAVETLSKVQTRAITENAFNLELQQLVLTKSGACIRAVAALHQNGQPLTGRNKEAARELHIHMRGVVGKIIRINQKTISDLQENTLDQLKNPAAFFKSPQWQVPQHLITLASYWLGWNGYYGSLVLTENDSLKSDFLNEAVKGFSRAFVDAKEDAAIASSLFGRGLCYSRLNEYEKARKDFKNVQMKTGKGDPLYLRCLYEDVRIIYRSGNYETAQRRLDEISEDFQQEKIPAQIATGLKNIRSKVLIALLKKQGASEKRGGRFIVPKNKHLFAQAKQLAVNPATVPDFYRYVQQNGPALENLTFNELGPVAFMALGDLYFDKKNYARALHFYQPILADFPTYIASYKDSVWFRSAYSHCKNERWQNAIILLDQFHSKFPESSLAQQAADLYYTAAMHHYEEKGSEHAQRHFINAAHIYIRQYKGKNPQLNKARFALAKHYQETGKPQKAAAEFALVTKDSPNYFAAQHHLLQYYVKTLKNMYASGQHHSNTALKIQNTGLGLLQKYKAVVKIQKGATPDKDKKPYLAVLESQLLVYGPNPDYQRILSILKPLEKHTPLQNKIYLEAIRLRVACYHHLQMPERIEQEMERLSISNALKSDGCALLYRLGNTYYQKGAAFVEEQAQSEAHRSWTTALPIFNKLNDISLTCPDTLPYSESARLRMAGIYMHQDQLDQAEALYQDILSKNSMSADAVYNLGMLYEKRQQWPQALGIWRKFSNGVEAGTYHWYESRYKTAVAHIRLGNTQKACDILTITLVLHPDFGKKELKDKYLGLKSKICR